MWNKEQLLERLSTAVDGVWSEYKKSAENTTWDMHYSIVFEIDSFCEQIADMIILNENLMNVR